MASTEDDWIIEVVPGDAGRADWAVAGRRDRRRARFVGSGLLVAVAAAGTLAALGYLAYRVLLGVLGMLTGVAVSIALAAIINSLEMIAIALVFLGRCALIAATGGVGPADVVAAWDLGRRLYEAWLGS